MELIIEVEQEADGRWLAEVLDLPGCLVYGETRSDAIQKVKALALQVDKKGRTSPRTPG